MDYDAAVVNGRFVEYLNEGKANTLESTFFTDEDGNKFPIRVGKSPIYDYDSLGTGNNFRSVISKAYLTDGISGDKHFTYIECERFCLSSLRYY